MIDLKALNSLRLYGSGIALTVLVFYLLLCNCFLFDNGRFNIIDVSGYVRSNTDSSAVPGACVLVSIELLKGKDPCADVYTDSLGYFEYTSTQPTEPYDAIQVELIAIDIDEAENGVFLSKDTLLIENDLDASSTINFEVDLYVEMVKQ